MREFLEFSFKFYCRVDSEGTKGHYWMYLNRRLKHKSCKPPVPTCKKTSEVRIHCRHYTGSAGYFKMRTKPLYSLNLEEGINSPEESNKSYFSTYGERKST